MTGSVWAALAGSIAWVAQPWLGLPMTWVAKTNQMMWAGSALRTVYCFARYCEDDDRRWLAGAWGCYLVGFGVLESNVAVAGPVVLYAWLGARRGMRAALLFVAPAVLLAALHLLLIPKRGGGAYGMELDAGMFIAAAVCAWLVSRKESRAVALLALGWFVFAVAPVLPLQRHVTDYYLTVPAVALLFAGLWQSGVAGWVFGGDGSNGVAGGGAASGKEPGYAGVGAWRGAGAEVESGEDCVAGWNWRWGVLVRRL